MTSPSLPVPAGQPPFVVTNRAVLAIAVPMTVAYVTTPLIGLVDTAVVGRFGAAAAIGGLAAGTVVLDVVLAMLNFLRSGTTGLVAQAVGSGDTVEEQAIFWRALLLAVVIGLAIALLVPVIVAAGVWFIAAEPDVDAAMATYAGVRLLGAPVSLVNYVLLGYVLGRGEAGFGLLLQLVLNGAHILLSLTFGLWLGGGIAGVALGAVCGEIVAASLGLFVLVRRFRSGPRVGRARVFDGPAILAMLSLNRDIMIRSFCLLAAFALFTRQGAQFGTATLAANAVLMNFFMIGAFFLDGFAAAAEQFAGRALGARHAALFRRAVWLTLVWGFVLAGLTALATLAFGRDLVAVITTAEDVRAIAAVYLPWAALTALSGVLAFQMDGVFIGATWSRDMRNMMVASLALYVLALIGLGRLYGNHGLWAALHIFLVARGLTLLAVLPARLKSAF